MKIGDFVQPINPRNQLRSGASMYDEAIVCSMEPFIMVSEGADMKWSTKKAEDYITVGIASDKILQACMKRLQ